MIYSNQLNGFSLVIQPAISQHVQNVWCCDVVHRDVVCGLRRLLCVCVCVAAMGMEPFFFLLISLATKFISACINRKWKAIVYTQLIALATGYTDWRGNIFPNLQNTSLPCMGIWSEFRPA